MIERAIANLIDNALKWSPAGRPVVARADVSKGRLHFGFAFVEAGVARLAAAIAGRILLVEDNPINAEVASAILTGAGFACATADNGRQAVEAVQQGLLA